MGLSEREAFASLEKRLQAEASPGTRPGLSRLARLCSCLDHPERTFQAVHIVGTNGKGSTASSLASILDEAGLRVGLYTSPHLESLGERLRLDGEELPLSLWERGSDVVLRALDSDPLLRIDPPTLFELLTALAFWLLRESGCRLAVFEAGMGGRLDATNLLPRVVLTLVTPIADDHGDYLGKTIEAIAEEKFAVLRPGVTALFAGGDTHLEERFLRRAQASGARGFLLSQWPLFGIRCTDRGTAFCLDLSDGPRDFFSPLLGRHQATNAAMALCGAHFLKAFFPSLLDEETLARGLSRTFWPGRMEILSREPIVILDGGHNPHGLTATLRSVSDIWGEERRRRALFAAMADKDFRSELALFREGRWDVVFTEVPNLSRGASVAALAEAAASVGLTNFLCEPRLDRAFSLAVEGSDLLLCTGSLYLVGALRSLLRAA
ncbi:bifunctional folylpolyglutamate synthase/dihydrofolate synthase [Aminirod propionatiphilus]|uniref:Bifunctional folylpolyglutamate synthase/dihydrofolate synthase n=1 Tax=Aminirod propionatiphilus TaxID=3415223 RepID=A0ACD1DZJ7_9BACT|nr:bifunctional folylpolyglutamate synthase/dihydrofolate synthase [Synergistota bacterium]